MLAGKEKNDHVNLKIQPERVLLRLSFDFDSLFRIKDFRLVETAQK